MKMKVILVLLATLGLVGCGAYQDVQQECDTVICDMLLGEEPEATEPYDDTKVQNEIKALESQILDLQLQLTAVQLPESVIAEIVDPCGDGAGVDEVLLRTRNYQYIAYFQQGSRRMLTVLERNTVYETTDQQRCRFVISSSGAIEYGAGL